MRGVVGAAAAAGVAATAHSRSPSVRGGVGRGAATWPCLLLLPAPAQPTSLARAPPRKVLLLLLLVVVVVMAMARDEAAELLLLLCRAAGRGAAWQVGCV